MRKNKTPTERYICPRCSTVYEVVTDEMNNTTPLCLNCGSPLLKIKPRR